MVRNSNSVKVDNLIKSMLNINLSLRRLNVFHHLSHVHYKFLIFSLIEANNIPCWITLLGTYHDTSTIF